MGKKKIGIYCYFIADILMKVIQKCLLSDPLPNNQIIYFLSKTLSLIGCHGNQKAKFANIFKNQLLRGYMRDKAESLQKRSKH